MEFSESTTTGGSSPGDLGFLEPSPRQQHHCLDRFTRSPPVHLLNLVKTNWVPFWTNSNDSHKRLLAFHFNAFQTHFKQFHFQFPLIRRARRNVVLSSGPGLLSRVQPPHTRWTHQTGAIQLRMTMCLLEISLWLHCIPWNWVSPSADTQQLPLVPSAPLSPHLSLSGPFNVKASGGECFRLNVFTMEAYFKLEMHCLLRNC